jgi:hypothetical protein
MASVKNNIKTFLPYKEDVVQYVEDLLIRLDQSEILQSITITPPEKLEDYFVIDATMSYLDEF